MNNPYEYCLRVSSNFLIEYVSTEFSDLLNYQNTDLIGKQFFNCFQLADCPDSCALKQSLLQGKPQIIQFSKSIDNGKKFHFKCLCKPVLSESNELLGIQKFIQNISDLKEALNNPIDGLPRFIH